MIRATPTPDSAEYFLCQYTKDVMRMEPRNVGVIVRSHDGLAAKFYAENENGSIDGRRLGAFNDPDNYRNWVDYWRRIIARKPEAVPGELFKTGNDHFAVIKGGYIEHSSRSNLTHATSFLYNMLVEEIVYEDAIGIEGDVVKSSPLLANHVAAILRERRLFEEYPGRPTFYRGVDVFGATRPHRFEFVQRRTTATGRIIETFDFERGRQKDREWHVGWAAFAFMDVAEVSRETEALAIVQKPSDSSKLDEFRAHMHTLEGKCKVLDVNSSDFDGFVQTLVDEHLGLAN